MKMKMNLHTMLWRISDKWMVLSECCAKGLFINNLIIYLASEQDAFNSPECTYVLKAHVIDNTCGPLKS